MSDLGSGRLLSGGGVGKSGRGVEVFFSSKEGGLKFFLPIPRGGVAVFSSSKGTFFVGL